ncbi:hypothetical protein ACFQ9X_08320 [Catenulispora yoronensis]
MTDLSAWQSSQLLESLPTVLLEPTRFDIAIEAAGRIQAAGGEAVLSCSGCARQIAPDAIPVSPEPCANWSTPPRCPGPLAGCVRERPRWSILPE